MLDPALQDYDLLGYLSRPALMSSAAMSERDHEDLQAWLGFVEGRGPGFGAWLGRFDAAVLREDRRPGARGLAGGGWQRQPLGHGFELWLAPGGDGSPHEEKARD